MNVTTEPDRPPGVAGQKALCVALDNATGEREVPDPAAFQRWACAALAGLGRSAAGRELSIRLVDDSESASLNATWRGKSGPTNILSFPMTQGLPGDFPLLGDLALCVPVIKREAREQGKAEIAHWAHLTVHGVLHLCGHDHEDATEAAVMESFEVAILNELGFADPYN